MQQRPSLSEQLADSIVELIHEQHLEPGDTLESSRHLAQRFDVTTPTIREALRRLEASSVVEMRHGSGVYVADGLTRQIMSNPHRSPITIDGVLELAEARLAIEPVIARLAAEHRDADSLALLEAAAQNALKDPVHGHRPELHFHVQLAGCSGNSLLSQTVDALLLVRSQDQVEIRMHYNDREQDHAEHLGILDAVRDGDVDAAEELTRAHLTKIRDVVRRTSVLPAEEGQP